MDKIIVTNEGALKAKYGTAGWRAIDAAVGRMIAADVSRGLVTKRIRLDHSADLSRFGAQPVPQVADQQATKKAIDQICGKAEPDYLLILGGSEIVTFQELTNSTPSDGDANVPSDLPYACTAPFSVNPRRFVAPSRVVGRLPDLVGAKQPDYLVKLVDRSAKHKPRPASDYGQLFALSCDVWKSSTATSIATLGVPPTTLFASPPAKSPQPKARLKPRLHFINCHGADSDPNFYGENPAGTMPISLSYTDLPTALTMDTVVTAECCYGAQLYDPVLAASHGLCLHYLDQGAIAFWGSSNIAWGPPSGNGQADYIAQYFLQEVLKGASVGRAALVARQRFVQKASPLLPVDLKTLAQFVLLGDPSVHPVAKKQAISKKEHLATLLLEGGGRGADRKQRRWALVAKSEQLEQSVLMVSKAIEGANGAVDAKLSNYAQNLGMQAVAHRVYRIEGGPRHLLKSTLRSQAKAAIAKSTTPAPLVHALVGQRSEQKKAIKRIAPYMIVYVFQYGDRLVKGPICLRR